MKARFFGILVGLLILATSAWLIAHWAAVARPKGNPGSCLLALSAGVDTIEQYVRDHGALPADLQELVLIGFKRDFAERIEYAPIVQLGIRTNSPPNVIIMTCRAQYKSGEKYVALLSGDIVLMRAEEAVLGKPCRSGRKVTNSR